MNGADLIASTSAWCGHSGHPLRVKILEVVQLRNASPSELTDLLPAPLGNVAYHVRVLEKCGCIEQVATARRRGAVEHYFRARPRSYIGHQDWRKVPRSLRDAVTGSALGTFFDRAADALESGTMDSHDDTTLNWMPMAVDEAGWAEVAAVFQAASNRLEAIHALCRKRMDQSGEEATATGGRDGRLRARPGRLDARRRRGRARHRGDERRRRRRDRSGVGDEEGAASA